MTFTKSHETSQNNIKNKNNLIDLNLNQLFKEYSNNFKFKPSIFSLITVCLPIA